MKLSKREIEFIVEALDYYIECDINEENEDELENILEKLNKELY